MKQKKKKRHSLFQVSPKLRCIAEYLRGRITQDSGKIGNDASKLLIDLIARNTRR